VTVRPEEISDSGTPLTESVVKLEHVFPLEDPPVELAWGLSRSDVEALLQVTDLGSSPDGRLRLRCRLLGGLVTKCTAADTLTRAGSKLARRSSRAGNGSVDLCGRGYDRLQLICRALGGHTSIRSSQGSRHRPEP
jgi:hypothetical protein